MVEVSDYGIVRIDETKEKCHGISNSAIKRVWESGTLRLQEVTPSAQLDVLSDWRCPRCYHRLWIRSYNYCRRLSIGAGPAGRKNRLRGTLLPIFGLGFGVHDSQRVCMRDKWGFVTNTEGYRVGKVGTRSWERSSASGNTALNLPWEWDWAWWLRAIYRSRNMNQNVINDGRLLLQITKSATALLGETYGIRSYLPKKKMHSPHPLLHILGSLLWFWVSYLIILNLYLLCEWLTEWRTIDVR